ncbi:MAG: AlwI family type II restriction endonuclease [Spirochaetia bacterium]|nr:AlwI family type II restriction endonuclease [Spirochaetia bacterium]
MAGRLGICLSNDEIKYDERTLEDYFDLNRRYLKISDTLLFADEQVKFDVIPKYYFSLLPEEFYSIAFEKSDKLSELQSLEEISPLLTLEESKLLKAINKDNKTSFSQIGDIKQFVADERTERFNKLIDEKFSDTQLIYILQLISKRADKEIQELVTDDADIPTIFEYILGIAWYKISERKGDILSFMNLSLEADLLPKTHAGGGEADLVFQYEAENGYPKHTLLIEATLADSTNQRRMEMEPVSRHLGEYMFSHKGLNSYCVFITNFLHMNVISDFRNRRKMEYYGGKNGDEVINGMMITPLENELLVILLKNKITYPKLYKLFHEIHKSPLAPKEWYEELKERIISLK